MQFMKRFLMCFRYITTILDIHWCEQLSEIFHYLLPKSFVVQKFRCDKGLYQHHISIRPFRCVVSITSRL
jgi:hypothetical protein